jgi:endonuclease YncB( thermonuclease family)
MHRSSIPASLIAAAMVLTAGTASAEQVVDGDTFELEGQEVRLFGVDAFELSQTCLDARGEPWRCGIAAKAALAERVQGYSLSCVTLEEDQDGRYLARCTLPDGTDVGGYLVENGLALADPGQPDAYAEQQASAQRSGAGAWGGTFMPPWQFRAFD